VEKTIHADETVYSWSVNTESDEPSLLDESGTLTIKDGLGTLQIGNIKGSMTCE